MSNSLPTLWTVDYQPPLSKGFSREYWSGFPCSPPGDLPNQGIELTSLLSPALTGRFFTTSATWQATVSLQMCLFWTSDRNETKQHVALYLAVFIFITFSKFVCAVVPISTSFFLMSELFPCIYNVTFVFIYSSVDGLWIVFTLGYYKPCCYKRV